jgi:4,5-dihydroxyphthalate decarboxylase
VRAVPLTLAISHYDHVRDLTTGRVSVEGATLRCLELPVEEIFFRTRHFSEWDVAEMSLAKFASMASQDDDSLVGIPVFPSRVFRHSSIYVPDGRLRDLSDLAGGTVGVPEWAQTASVYTRALLAEEYGVPLGSIRWLVAGVNSPGRKEKVRLNLPPGLNVTWVDDRSLDELLLGGDVDAVLSARPPRSFEAGTGQVRRFFADHAEVEFDYASRTGIVPIMHLVVIRRAVADAHPWLAANLFDAFEEARQRSIARLREVTISRFPLLWPASEMDRTSAVFGQEYWPYGVAANWPTLDAFLGWSHEQGVTHRRLAPEELFPESVRTRFVI